MGIEYTNNERILMALITGSSNFVTIPVCLYVAYKKKYFEFFMGVFTILTSFLYHVCESLDVVFYLDQQKWHILDNIGSIACINTLLISFMNVSEKDSLKLNLISLMITLIMQQDDPWELMNTIIPILIFVGILIYKLYKHSSRRSMNKLIMAKGFSVLILALSMFVIGLDDANDYLRIYHSLWHVFIAISTFYLWQKYEVVELSMREVILKGFETILYDF